MAIVENIKEAVNLARKIDNIDLYRALLDSQGEALELMEDLRKKDDKIQQLEKALEIKGKLIINRSAYYLMDDSGNPVDGPFCTKCFDVDHIICRLARSSIDLPFSAKDAKNRLRTIQQKDFPET